MKRVIRELFIMAVAAAIFSTLFILGHLALYQTWPRWK